VSEHRSLILAQANSAPQLLLKTALLETTLPFEIAEADTRMRFVNHIADLLLYAPTPSIQYFNSASILRVPFFPRL